MVVPAVWHVLSEHEPYEILSAEHSATLSFSFFCPWEWEGLEGRMFYI